MSPIKSKGNNDCFACCVATLLDFARDSVPDCFTFDKWDVEAQSVWFESKQYFCMFWDIKDLDNKFHVSGPIKVILGVKKTEHTDKVHAILVELVPVTVSLEPLVVKTEIVVLYDCERVDEIQPEVVGLDWKYTNVFDGFHLILKR